MQPTEKPENFFQVHNLTEDEIVSGHTLTQSQYCVIQNLVASYAHEQLAITYADAEPTKAAIQAAHCRGARQALQHLLDSHDALIEAQTTGKTSGNSN